MPSEASLANLRPPWQPGRSANTVGAKGYRRVLATARKASPEAMEAAVECMRDTEASWRERLAAIQMILDRAWGKPKEQFDFTGVDGANIMIVTGVPRPEGQQDTNVSTHTDAYTIEYDAGEEEEPP
jgi:hypothetical protein